MRFKAFWIGVMLLAGAVATQAQINLKLNVNLQELRGREVLPFMRAVVPEVYGGTSVEPLDLSALATLHGTLTSRFPLENPEDEAEARYYQGRLEALMRERLATTNLSKLQKMALGDGDPYSGNGHLMPALYRRFIEAEIAAIRKQPKRSLQFPAEASAIPEPQNYFRPRGADDKALRRAFAPFATLQAKTVSVPLTVDGSPRGYSEIADAFLRGRDKKAANKLLQFQWNGRCLTGYGEFRNEQLTMVFLGLLRERRIEEALGASLLVQDSPLWMREPGRPFDQWRIDLLQYCGFDWEEVLIAAGRLAFLAASGSERAARHEITAERASIAENGHGSFALQFLAPFLIPGDPSEWNEKDPRRAISAQTQADILALVSGAVQKDSRLYDVKHTLDCLEALRRPETKDALKLLTKHPSVEIANRAVQVLNGMGEDIALREPEPPVRFRIYRNEEPWRSAEFYWRPVDAAKPNAFGDVLKTDTEGFANLPRAELLDPSNQATRLKIGIFPYKGGNGGSHQTPLDKPWVEVEIPTPKALDETTAVHLASCALPVEILYATPPESGSVATTKILLNRAGETSSTEWTYDVELGPDTNASPASFTLSNIVPGDYQLTVSTPGSAKHVTAPFTVAPGMAPVRVKLEKGSHVYARIASPQNARGTGTIALFQNGRDITAEVPPLPYADDSKPRFTALPRGHYQFRVLSTAEFMTKFKITEWEASKVSWQPDLTRNVDCEGLTVDFTIDDHSPANLDLGVLQVSPVAEMKAKASGTSVRGVAPPSSAPAQ